MINDFRREPESRRSLKLDTFRNEPSESDTPASQNPEPAFRPPEEIAQQESTQKSSGFFLPPLEKLSEIDNQPAAAERQGWRKFFHKPNLTRKQWIIVGVAAVVLIGGLTTFLLTHKKAPPPPQKATVKAIAKPVPKPIISPLTGLPVTTEQQNYPVIGAMIENSPDARPQSGLDQAGVVFEAIAEGGITRFLALYQESSPAVLGPVRSSRPYYLDWAMAFDASYAHVGGSPDALQRIKDLGVKDLDQFYNASAYHRVTTRFAPHNMYTSVSALRDLSTAKGYTKSTFTPFIRAVKEAPSKTPTAKSIDFDISGSTYNVHYDYDVVTNTYKRSEGGVAHIDNETQAQLSPKVVIALAMPYSLMADGYHSMYQTTGSGNMLLFQNGTVTPGTWSKEGPKDQFMFKDGAGKDMQLNPGQTWITVLGDISQATYKP